MAMNLRVRSRTGAVNLRGVSAALSLADLRRLIEKEAHVAPANQILKVGFPPKELTAADAAPISSLLADGDTLTLEESTTPLTMANAQENKSEVTPSDKAHERERSKEHAATGSGANSIAVDALTSVSEAAKNSTIAPTTVTSEPAMDAIPFVSLSEGGEATKRVMADDNSCLFNTIAYCIERDPSKVTVLRRIVAQGVLSDPERYNAAVLGKTPSDYSAWIAKPTSWGGDVELAILSEHFKCEIVAFDVTRGIAHRFGEGEGYTKRIFTIYDGIHYDALVYALVPDMPLLDLDTTLFHPDDHAIFDKFQELVMKEKAAGRFVDEYNYVLQCGTCKTKVKGNKEAVAHSKATGHSNFEQSS